MLGVAFHPRRRASCVRRAVACSTMGVESFFEQPRKLVSLKSLLCSICIFFHPPQLKRVFSHDYENGRTRIKLNSQRSTHSVYNQRRTITKGGIAAAHLKGRHNTTGVEVISGLKLLNKTLFRDKCMMNSTTDGTHSKTSILDLR